MPSQLGWLDHDPHERERTVRILSLFRESATVDELGLGGIRDSFADQFFPGTSTVQTRLRYMLFVPWVYRQLEREGVPSTAVERKGRALETRLIDPLLASGEDGVLGRLAREALKQLPSLVYWNGLASWGIRRFDGTQSQYHRAFDRLHALRAAARRRDDGDVDDGGPATWDPELPQAPATFPADVSFALTREEAEYLRDRICASHPRTLLAWLARDPEPVPDVEALWLHPRAARFEPEHRELVHHARLFALVMNGAAVLYNLELARKRDSDESIQEHREGLEQWLAAMTEPEMRGMLRHWSLRRLWELVTGHGHAIGERARQFVSAWTEVALAGSIAAADSDAARRLIRERERGLKGARSRFDNQRALEQWSGRSGLRLFDYRWTRARTLLRDLKTGLQREGQG